MALKRLCRCGKVIDYGQSYCAECQIKHEQQRKDMNLIYKHSRIDMREQAFYTSPEWIQTRGYIKGKYDGLCLYSYYVLNQIIYCDVIHHIVELKDVGGWEQRLNHDNLISLSDGVHNQVHIWYKQGKKEEVQALLRELKIRWEKEMGALTENG